MHYIDNFLGLGKQVYFICIVRILVATGCIVSFMTSLLYNSVLGMDTVETGFYISLNYVFCVLGTLIGGKAADRFSRKNTAVVLIGVTGISIAIASFFCRQRLCIPFLTVAYGASYATFPVLSAMVADSCKPEKSQESFSLMYLGQNVGFALGPAIGGLLFYKHLVGMFWASAVLYFISIAFMMFFVKNTERRVTPVYAPGGEKASKAGGTLNLLLKSRPLTVFVVAMFFVSVCYCMLNFLMALHMAELFGLEKGSSYSGYVWTLNGVCVLVLTPLIVGFTKRRHQFSNMVVALGFYALGFGAYGFAKSPAVFFIFCAVWTAGEIMINTGSAAFIAVNSPATHVARFQSALETATALGKTVSPMIYGILTRWLSYGSCWLINAAACLVLGIAMFIAYRTIILKGDTHE